MVSKGIKKRGRTKMPASEDSQVGKVGLFLSSAQEQASKAK
jgi:hypothetical protein